MSDIINMTPERGDKGLGLACNLLDAVATSKSVLVMTRSFFLRQF